MNKTRLLLFDGCRFKEVDVGDGIDDYYKYLDCTTFDIVSARIGKKRYDIFCDDEGLFKEEQKITAVYVDGDRVVSSLVGNLIFANHDNAGNTTSLSKNDIRSIKNSVGLLQVGDKFFGVVRISF